MTQGWQPLAPWGSDRLPPGSDPYLVMAEATDYADYRAGPLADDAAFAVALEMPDLQRPEVDGLLLHAGHDGSRYGTGTATRAALRQLVEQTRFDTDDPQRPRRVLLAAPLVPQRPPLPWQGLGPLPAPAAAPAPAALAKADAQGGPEVLLAVIDSGCPFAHRDLRRGAASTRVVRLWDQGSGAHWSGLGQPPDGYGYGCELADSQLGRLIAQSTAAGSLALDESQCYRRAGYGAVLSRASHGAHTLGILASPRRWNARRHGGCPEERQAQEAAASADIVFVQLGHELTRCISVAAVESRALDALRYVLQQARDWKQRRQIASDQRPRVLVSFGYESWIGPHDGTSWFEAALDDLIAAANLEFDFQVHMIAGNARGQHVHITEENKVSKLDFDICVQPGNETVTWIEVWTPPGLTDLSFELRPPHGPPLPALQWNQAVGWPEAARPQACVVTSSTPANGPGSRMVLLRIAPTQVFDGRQAPAPHGRWHVTLRSEQPNLQGVHAYLGRSDEGRGRPLRARQSHFAERAGEALQAVDKTGTLNGHACGKLAVVSGAYYRKKFPYARAETGVLADEATTYSGTGPTRSSRAGPDAVLAVDDGLYAYGTLAMGNTSATVLRMDGTSVAAPMRARLASKLDAAKNPVPGQGTPPNPPDPDVGRVRFDPFDDPAQ